MIRLGLKKKHTNTQKLIYAVMPQSSHYEHAQTKFEIPNGVTPTNNAAQAQPSHPSSTATAHSHPANAHTPSHLPHGSLTPTVTVSLTHAYGHTLLMPNAVSFVPPTPVCLWSNDRLFCLCHRFRSIKVSTL